MNDRDCENCKHHTEKGCDSWDCNFERRMTRAKTKGGNYDNNRHRQTQKVRTMPDA